jgi:hypothetical protein
MPVMHDSPEWRGLITDVGNLKTEQASMRSDLGSQGERIQAIDGKVDKLNTIVYGDAESLGLRGEITKLKEIMKQIRFLVYLITGILLAEYTPKLADIISYFFK